MYLVNSTVSDGQSFSISVPDGAIARFPQGATVYTVIFSPDGKLLASGDDDNTVILWDVANQTEQEIFTEHTKPVYSVAFSPDGTLLASASIDRYVILRHVFPKGRRVTRLRHDRPELGRDGWVESVAFSPDGKLLASGGGDQEDFVVLWDIHQKRDIGTFSGHERLVESVSFSPNGRLLASAARDNTIKLWDVSGQRLRKILSGHSSVVHAVTFSPDGETLASSSRDNTIKLWKVSSGENLITHKIKIENSLDPYAEAITFSPDGKLLAFACVDYTVRLWNVSDRSETATLTGHHGGVTSVAFSPDGRTLASGSRDRTVLLWDLSYFRFQPQLQDIIPPEIVIHSPMKRTVQSPLREIPVEVNVTDDSRIADVRINGREPSVSERDVFGKTVPLNQGKNEIRITATDIHGNMGTHLFTIVRDDLDPIPPKIVIHSPTSRTASVTTEQFSIEGSVIGGSGIVDVWVDNVKVEVSEVGEFAATILLNFGENEFYVIATDTDGNIDRNVLNIYREDTEGPKIQIISPAHTTSRGLRRINPLPESVPVSGIVTDPSGVAEVRVNGEEVEVKEDKFERTVPLEYGNNLIRVTATDIPGNSTFEELTIFRPQPPVPLPDPPVPYPPVPIGMNYALLFAVNTYDHWDNLRFPLVDAIKVKQDLENIYGFQVELIDNPTAEEVIDGLNRYAQKEYDPEDQLLIFFAGHGYFDEGFKIGHLVARDTQRPNNSGSLLSHLSHSYLRDIIDRMSCEHVFLVMDTCYSGTFDERLAMRGEEEDVSLDFTQADVTRVSTYTTRWYLTSGAKEQVPDDSLFIRAFLKALRSEGGRDNVLTIEEILTYLEGIRDPTPCFDEFGRNDPGSDFLFIREFEKKYE